MVKCWIGVLYFCAIFSRCSWLFKVNFSLNMLSGKSYCILYYPRFKVSFVKIRNKCQSICNHRISVQVWRDGYCCNEKIGCLQHTGEIIWKFWILHLTTIRCKCKRVKFQFESQNLHKWAIFKMPSITFH